MVTAPCRLNQVLIWKGNLFCHRVANEDINNNLKVKNLVPKCINNYKYFFIVSRFFIIKALGLI